MDKIVTWYLDRHPPSNSSREELEQIKSSQEIIEPALEERFKAEFEKYEDEIRNSKSYLEKFKAMGQLLTKLEMAHVFKDGNQRTYSFILLNRLLIENNLPPAILEDPYLFDGYEKYPADTIAHEIERGIKNYLWQVHQGEITQKVPHTLDCKSAF